MQNRCRRDRAQRVVMTLVDSIKQGLLGGNILAHGSTSAANYLSWRRNCLMCALMLWVVALLLMLAILPNRKAQYTEAISSLGDIAEFAEGLASFMFLGDLLMTFVSFLCFGLDFFAFLRNSNNSVSRKSMKMLKVAWGLNTFAPFLTLLLYAGRDAVDWDGE